ncbi:outer membrane protein assembly factor BamE [Amycolatopsis suaedae]|uniref:Outer membrane protein assembly factor BamE n=1 Tax=Amycolatopsis suaedae TaxID=2510978 RepID=A0A4V2EMK1_9PSEU|nr:outer membrane protein assembly factor BamE [Amycolatopsis suaedae]RZQ65345.1 outer membrane protein assembly factor BamE [Amycolatopsis suaedae]
MGTITVGMTKRQVKRLLGPPSAKTSTRSYLRETRRAGGSVAGFGRVPRDAYWLYLGKPGDRDIQIVFRGNRVTEVTTPPARAT